MSMFSLINAEFKKIILRPSVILMLVAILALSIVNILTFSPTPRYVGVSFNSSSPSDLYTKFKVSSSEVFSKNKLQANLDASEDYIREFTLSNSDYQDFLIIYNSTKEAYDSLCAEIEKEETDAELATIKTKTTNYKSKLTDLSTKFKSTFMDNKRYLVPIKSYNGAIDLMDKQIITLSPYSSLTDKSYADFTALLKNFNQQDIYSQLPKVFGKIELIKIDTEKADELIIRSASSANVQLNDIELKFDNVFNASTPTTASDDLTKMQDLITQYYYTCQLCEENLSLTLKLAIAENKSDAKMKSFINYQDFSRLEFESITTKNSYVLSNKIYENDYLNTLRVGYTSGLDVNTYDYTIYSMQYIIVLIVIFSILVLSKIISGEQGAGTLKMVAIRPYSRTKLFLGKVISVAFFGGFLLLFAALFNFVVGIAIFGLPSTNLIISVFNGTKIVLTSPFGILCTSLASQFASIFVYASLLGLICVLVRSQTGSTLLGLGTYGICILLNSVASGGQFYKLLPNANFDFYKFFGGVYSPAKTTDLISGSLPPDTSALFTIIYYIVFVVFINTMSLIAFNKKDIA